MEHKQGEQQQEIATHEQSTKISNLFYSDCSFVFEYASKQVYILEQFLYNLCTQQLECEYILIQNPIIHHSQQQNLKEEQSLKTNQLDQVLENNQQQKQIENSLLSKDCQEKNEYLAFSKDEKNYYSEYFSIIDLKLFSQKIETGKFFIQKFSEVKQQGTFSHQKFAVFCFFAEKNYTVDSGILFGGDYVLYEKKENKSHSHSVYTVCIQDANMTNVDLCRKIKIAVNARKKVIMVDVKKSQEFHQETLNYLNDLILTEQFTKYYNLIKKLYLIQYLVYSF